MPLQNAEDLFVTMLSHVHTSEQRLQRGLQEISQKAQDPYIKEVLDVRSHLTQQAVSNIEKCFQLLGKQPTKVDARFAEVWVEDTAREVGAIQNPTVKALYVLNAVRKIQDFHIAEYVGLTAMASLMGNEPVTTLLERNTSDKVQFIERSREIFREECRKALGAKVKERLAERMAG